MARRAFVVRLAALAAPLSAIAQSARKPVRVGYLSMAKPEADRHWVAAFRQGMRELGYIEGQSFVLEQRHAANDASKVPQLAAELLHGAPSVMVVYGTPAILHMKNAETSVPIVMTVHADPVGSGIVASLARPGGNITGLTDGHTDLAPKRLQLLREVVPTLRRVGVLFNPTNSGSERQWRLVQAAASGAKVTALAVHIRGSNEIGRAFETAHKKRIDGLVF